MHNSRGNAPTRARGILRRLTTLATLSIMATFCLAQEPVTEQPAPAAVDTGTPKLEVSTTVWDFGEKWSGEKAETTITLKNAGDAPLKIDQVKSSCGCTVAKVQKKVFQPGESEEVKVTYNTKKKTPNVSQKIRVESNDPVSPVTVIEVKGKIKELIKMSEARGLNFGALGPNDVVTKSVEIECTYTEPLKLKLEEAEYRAFDVQLEELEAGKHYRLTATTKPPLSDGATSGEVQLLTGLELLPEVSVRVWGIVQPPVAVAPKTLLVTNQMTGVTQRIVRVTSLRDKPITVTGVTTSDPAIEAEIVKMAARPTAPSSKSNVMTIRVTLPPGAQVPDEGAQVTITTDDDEYAELVVPIIKRSDVRASSAARPSAQPAGAAAVKKAEQESTP